MRKPAQSIDSKRGRSPLIHPVWESAIGLRMTPVFQSRFATNETGYLNTRLRTSRISTLNSQRSTAELLRGSLPSGTGGWKPLELGEVLWCWIKLSREDRAFANHLNQ